MLIYVVYCFSGSFLTKLPLTSYLDTFWPILKWQQIWHDLILTSWQSGFNMFFNLFRVLTSTVFRFCIVTLSAGSASTNNLAGSLSCVRSLSCTRLRCTSCFLCLARSTLPYLLRLLSASWFVIVFEFYTRFRYCCLGHCCKWLSFVQLTVQSLSAIEIVCIVCASPRCLGWKVRESRLCLRDARGVVRLWELIRTWCDLIRLSFDFEWIQVGNRYVLPKI